MGLNVVVGNDDGEHPLAGEIAAANTALARAGLPTWEEPSDVPPDEFEMYGYSGMHTLRRVAAHLREHDRLPLPREPDEDAAGDPVLASLYAAAPSHWVIWEDGHLAVYGAPAPRAFDHLIFHSDAEGFYAPVDFAPVLVDETILGGCLGSAPRLLAECLALAAALGVDPELDPWSPEVSDAVEGEAKHAEGWRRYPVETFTCLQLIAAARTSVEKRAAVIFE